MIRRSFSDFSFQGALRVIATERAEEAHLTPRFSRYANLAPMFNEIVIHRKDAISREDILK